MSYAPKTISLRPRISEKTFRLSEDGTYVFDVPIDANKIEVKAAVEVQFGVTVVNVRSQVRKGKSKRSVQRRTQPIDGVRANRKQMYVTLKDGDSLPIFEEIN